MERPLSSKVADTVEEMANEIAKVIRYIDSQIFKDHAVVNVLDDDVFQGRLIRDLNVANYVWQNHIWKIFGVPDKYIIFTKSKDAEDVRKKPFGIIGSAIHEVRHRYQRENHKCLISANFARFHRRCFDKEQVYDTIVTSEKNVDEHMLRYEFDALLIESIYNLNHQHPNMNRELIISLVTCNQESILEIISKLK